MPSLGADMDSGVLLERLVHPGDHVNRGDIVAVVDTAKAAVEIESFDTGIIDRLFVEPGTQVPVGAPLAVISTEAPSTVAAAAPAPAPTPAAGPAPKSSSPGRATSPLVRRIAAERHVDLATVRGTGLGGRVTHADVERAAAAAKTPPARPSRPRTSPLARRLATELDVDLSRVTGTGPGGAIGAGDVQRAAATARPEQAATVPPAAGHEAADRTAAMRAAIAALMARANREIPHYYLTETVDLAAAIQWLHERNRELPVPQRILPAALLLKAAARAAAAVPELNGFWTDDHFVPADAVHLGVAVSLRGGGLVAPAIHHADQRDLSDLMAALRDLAIRTRAGRLRRAELSDPTITVSNLGEQGVESFHGVIYPPQVALVGFGRITSRPWAVDGLIGVRPLVTVSLAADHRATDARYLTTVARLLQRPEEL